MKTNLIITAAILSVTLSTEANARKGGEVGNGGGAHICYTDASKTQIKSIETYDLFEGRKLYKTPGVGPRDKDYQRYLGYKNNPEHRKLMLLDESKERVLKGALERIQKTYPEFHKKIVEVLEYMNDPKVLIDATDIKLSPVPDSNLLLLGSNCEYHQMVNWLDPEELVPGSTDRMLRDESIYTIMSPISQAALDLHEAVYKVYRTYADPATLEKYLSRPVRKFVAQAITGDAIDPLLDETAFTGRIEFESENIFIYLPKQSECLNRNLELRVKWLNPNQRSGVTLKKLGGGDSWTLLGTFSEENQWTVEAQLPVPGKIPQFSYSLAATINRTPKPEFEITLRGCGLPEFKQVVTGNLFYYPIGFRTWK